MVVEIALHSSDLSDQSNATVACRGWTTLGIAFVLIKFVFSHKFRNAFCLSDPPAARFSDAAISNDWLKYANLSFCIYYLVLWHLWTSAVLYPLPSNLSIAEIADTLKQEEAKILNVFSASSMRMCIRFILQFLSFKTFSIAGQPTSVPAPSTEETIGQYSFEWIGKEGRKGRGRDGREKRGN